jgi:hypothetical protein
MAIAESIIDIFVQEVWRPISGYEGLYSVSNLGRIRNELGFDKRWFAGRILEGTKTKKGYIRIALSREGKKKFYRVHCLVASAFIGKCPTGMQVNHKDLNKSNNRLDNLEDMTPLQNIRHFYSSGLKRKKAA